MKAAHIYIYIYIYFYHFRLELQMEKKAIIITVMVPGLDIWKTPFFFLTLENALIFGASSPPPPPPPPMQTGSNQNSLFSSIFFSLLRADGNRGDYARAPSGVDPSRPDNQKMSLSTRYVA